MRSLYFVGSLFLTLVSCRAAASQSLVTDRPDFTESAITIPKGSVQVESGLTVSKIGDIRTTNGPELLLRWGLAGQVEVRLQSPDFVFENGSSGVGDPSVGFKIAFSHISSWSIAAIAATSIPVGESGEPSRDFEPLLILTFGKEFGQLSFGSQIEGTWDGSSEQILLGGTLVLGTPLSDRIGAFAEATVSQEPIGIVAVSAHSGLTLSVSHLVQLDLHLGAGLTENAPDLLVGAGLSLRR
jgi:hypothetical protein